MTKTKPARFWIEFGLAAISAACAILTVLRPQWIEAIFGIVPDYGAGWSEGAMALSLIVGSLMLFALARRDWRSVCCGS